MKVLDEFNDELRAQWQVRDKRMRKAYLERCGSLKNCVEPVKESWKVSFLGFLFASSHRRNDKIVEKMETGPWRMIYTASSLARSQSLSRNWSR